MIYEKRVSDDFTYVHVMDGENASFDKNILCLIESIQYTNDPLKDNYTLKSILDKLFLFGYLKNNDGEIVYFSGVESFGDEIHRIETKTYVPPKFRTSSWMNKHNYLLVDEHKFLLRDSTNFLFKSREAKSSAIHKKCMRMVPESFPDWKIYPTQIQLRYKDNWQWIMYKSYSGDEEEHLNKLRYKE